MAGARSWLPLLVFWTLAGTAALLLGGGMVMIYWRLAPSTADSPAPPPAASSGFLPTCTSALVLVDPAAAPDRPDLPSPDLPNPDLPNIAAVTFDSSGQYAFPIAADPAWFAWTHIHWDGSHAADLEVRAGVSFVEFLQLTRVPLVAITGGTLADFSGNVGGLGYILHGDDGLDYYYAHLSEQWMPDGARVAAGQLIGRLGNTGGSAQFIEPHLHFAVGPRDTLWDSPPTLNAAEYLRARFGLAWIERTPAPVPYALPHGWPVRHPALVITTPFDQAAAHGLPQPALRFGFVDTAPGGPQDVFATLDGEINVIRWTAYYGTRLQITNRAADVTVVISGLEEWWVEDGAVVSRGQVIGRWNPAHYPDLHYMIFQNGVIIDPTPSLGGSAFSTTRMN